MSCIYSKLISLFLSDQPINVIYSIKTTAIYVFQWLYLVEIDAKQSLKVINGHSDMTSSVETLFNGHICRRIAAILCCLYSWDHCLSSQSSLQQPCYIYRFGLQI